MKPLSLLFLALISAVAGLGTYFVMGTVASRSGLSQTQPEMEWLRQEYRLTDAQFTEIQALHRDYAPICEQMCAAINDSQKRLRQVITAHPAPTPAMEEAVRDLARIEADCRSQTLAHLYAVSAHMAPEARPRFLSQMSSRMVHSHPLQYLTSDPRPGALPDPPHHATGHE